jgi:hypothetical protein
MHAHCIRRIEVSDVIRAVDAQMTARHLGAAAPATASTDQAPGEADAPVEADGPVESDAPGEADAPVESDAPVDTTDEAAHAGR